MQVAPARKSKTEVKIFQQQNLVVKETSPVVFWSGKSKAVKR